MVDESPFRDTGAPVPAAKSERELRRESWREWFREDFLRSAFVGLSLAWDGLGAAQMRYSLDPWYPGQGASAGWVYGAIAAFVIVSLVAQVLLYRWWWPPGRPRLGHKPLRNPYEQYTR